MFKFKQKKGFTLVELLVVIAILAILATASLIGYSSFTKKANISNDNTVIAELNRYVDAYKALDNDINTVTDVATALDDSGFEISKLKASTKGYRYAFDIKEDEFVLLDDNYDYYEDSKSRTNFNVFAFVSTKTELDAAIAKNLSAYLLSAWTDDTISTSKGIDVGKNDEITSITYNNNGVDATTQDVVIRTNSASTTLTIDAASDTVRHYDVCGIVDVIKTANASYHEYGNVKYIENDYGHVVIESGATVETVVLTASSDIENHPATLENNGGTITNNYATTNAVASANNAEIKNVQLVLQPVSSSGNVLADNEEAAKTIIVEKKDESASAAVSATLQSASKETLVARISQTTYTDFDVAMKALIASTDECPTLTLMSDVNLTTNGGYNVYKIEHDFILNGNGYKITANDSVGATLLFYVDGDNVNGRFENLIVDSKGYNYAIIFDDGAVGTLRDVKIYSDNISVCSSGNPNTNKLCLVNCYNSYFEMGYEIKTRTTYAETNQNAVCASGGGTLNLYECTIKSDVVAIGCWPSAGKVYAENSVIEAGRYASLAGIDTSYVTNQSIIEYKNCSIKSKGTSLPYYANNGHLAYYFTQSAKDNVNYSAKVIVDGVVVDTATEIIPSALQGK